MQTALAHFPQRDYPQAMNRKPIVCLFCCLLPSLSVFSNNTNTTELRQTPKVTFASVLSARAELDKELQTNFRKFDTQELKAVRSRISQQAGELSRVAEIFVEQFPTNNNVLQAAEQAAYGNVLHGALHKEDSVVLDQMAEQIPSCLFEADTCENLPLSTIQAARLQAKAESGFAAGAIVALRFDPENDDGMFWFIKRARTEAGRKLAQAFLDKSDTNNLDIPFRRLAESVLNRKYSVGRPLLIKFTAIDGRKVDVSEMHGKVILVDFWATDCMPCMAGLPELKSLFQKYHDQGFEIIGISTDGKSKPVARVIQEKAIPWPNYMDAEGPTNKFAVACGVYGIPDYWLVDRKGIVREMAADKGLDKKIQFLLAEKP